MQGSACTAFNNDPVYDEFTDEQSTDPAVLLCYPRFHFIPLEYPRGIEIQSGHYVCLRVWHCECCDLLEEGVLCLKRK